MAQHLPTYLLYAEDAGIAPSDVMHAESIAERSSLHSWEIRPHRHEALFQLFHVDSGTAEILLDGERHDLRGPGVITIMPLARSSRSSNPTCGNCLPVTTDCGRACCRRAARACPRRSGAAWRRR
jgi:hypothetical protein